VIKRFAFVLVVVLLGACSSLSPIKTQSQHWRNNNIANYSYDIQWSCFCNRDLLKTVHIEVINSKLVSRKYLDSKKAIPSAYYNLFGTMDDLIKILEDAEEQNAYKINILWNKDYNYPESSNIDYIKDAVDDERAFRVTNFKIK